jgi:histidinol-phosphate aminotransferase
MSSAVLAKNTAEALLQRIARPEILAMSGYVSARMEAGSAEVILNANENPYAPPLEGTADWHINRYPPPQPQQVITQLADLYGVACEQLLVTRGSDEGIDLLTRACCRAGVDRVVYCPPAFGMYAVSAAIQGALIEAIALDAEWQPDIDAIVAAQPKLVFLCHPNNPTGNLMQRQRILDLCQRLSDQALVIVDEAYIEFADVASMTSELSRLPNLVILRTLSKAWGMAGLRCGAVLADAAIIALLRKIMAPYPLSIASQALVAAALGERQQQLAQAHISELVQSREQMLTALQALQQRHPQTLQQVWPSAGNFLLVKVADGGQLVNAAAEQGILLRNQSRQPGLNNCVRISIGSAAENRRLLQFIEAFCQ